MRKLTVSALMVGVAVVVVSTPAVAKDLGTSLSKERFQIRVRAIDVVPNEDSSVSPIGGEIKAGNAVVPEVDVTYFFTPNIAAELIAATSKHKLSHNSAGKLGESWILPPTLTLQYHFTPDSKFSPYVGAGLNYSMFYGEDSAAGFTDLDVDGGVGTALQVGADFWMNENWGVNLDVKKIFLDVDASVNNGAVTADVDLDPWVLGAGVSYRF